ncbi:hypothetical protein L226DRAFT_610838 [Lentinus tigrinus ALCF2SS1-7]|uniref:Zn(2)-C6 fungal-type domain-containing protein n=1 Tax=Lentinus tigrinus ALCF2SS1-6 TaxID=1328759 RepID=A0A5C2SHF8_9APHY|nr:hypothetical protein L227DRAFT_573195 [Lentinus tigrinus ALCF2SS1-6]RPD77564.1 hypothetical protein L226DRAFT_610838 [Lentinus tigrinus ALCF2SS1-7]
MTSIPVPIDYSLVALDTTELENILGIPPSSHTGTISASPGTSGISEPFPSEQARLTGNTSCSPSSSLAHVSTVSHKRVRPKIDLAPDQPPTVRGNPRIRVFVACYPCRARKIRCDGAKPICHNCQKRSFEAEQCHSDSGTNRRGREKRGREKASVRTRASQQRYSSKKPPTPKRSVGGDSDRRTNPSEDVLGNAQALSDKTRPDLNQVLPSLETDFFEFSDAMWEFDPDPLLYDVAMSTSFSQYHKIPDIMVIPSQQENKDVEQEQQKVSIPSQPGARFARDTWWDALLTFYATEHDPVDTAVVSLSSAQRGAAMKTIMTDLRALLQSSPCWISFLHLPRFFDTLFNPIRRHSLQPSLLLSALALGAFVQSSEVHNGARGRQKALTLLEMAHGALEGALATGWVDMGLAQAALLIVFFEMQSHPLQSVHRSHSAILLLDSLMRLFSLSTVDEGIKPRGLSPFTNLRPKATYSGFNPAAQLGFMPAGPSIGDIITPSLSSTSSSGGSTSDSASSPASSDYSHASGQRGCNCLAISLGTAWPPVHNIAPGFASTIMWPEGMAEADFKREECRRLVWTCVMVVANLHAYMAATPDSNNIGHGNLFVREPENFALMLPGEALAASGTYVEPDDMWTLCTRTTFLFHVCMRVRESKNTSQADRAQLAVQAWLEIEDLEQRLARHTCDLDISIGFQMKELLFGMRMLTSYEFRNFIPQVTTTGSRLFYRDKAEEWLRFVDTCNEWVWKTLSKAKQAPSQDHRKSILIFWFIANIRRALALWQNDPDLIYGLEVSKRFAERTEYLMSFWPNPRLREVWQGIRVRVVAACLQAGIPPPSPSIPQIPGTPSAV